MTEHVKSGNAGRDGAGHRQWFIGPFLDEAAGPRRSGHVEVKWAAHPKGQVREAWAAGAGMTTVSILVRGRFRIDFREPDGGPASSSVLLSEEGDYALWTRAVEHTWRAEEDSVVVTVRWRDP
jgi:hypothetical protein